MGQAQSLTNKYNKIKDKATKERLDCEAKYEKLGKGCEVTLKKRLEKLEALKAKDLKKISDEKDKATRDLTEAQNIHIKSGDDLLDPDKKSSFGITNKLRSDAKRYNVKLTTMKYGRRYYKNPNVIRRQINNKKYY